MISSSSSPLTPCSIRTSVHFPCFHFHECPLISSLPSHSSHRIRSRSSSSVGAKKDYQPILSRTLLPASMRRTCPSQPHLPFIFSSATCKTSVTSCMVPFLILILQKRKNHVSKIQSNKTSSDAILCFLIKIYLQCLHGMTQI